MKFDVNLTWIPSHAMTATVLAQTMPWVKPGWIIIVLNFMGMNQQMPAQIAMRLLRFALLVILMPVAANRPWDPDGTTVITTITKILKMLPMFAINAIA